MPFEAIEALETAEETVRSMLADAAAVAKQRLAAARDEGEQALSDAISKAENELAQMNRTADEKAKAEVRAKADNNANRKAAMQAKAEARADQAAAFIVERIVNS